MRALRVVGISEDGGGLSVVLEDSARHERFTVPADEQLRAAARGDLTRLGQISIELESQLRPREIQARIRAGASVDQVAAAAGVPPQKIERFAYPVLLERSRTAEVAQRAHPMRAEGPDSRMLGDVVAHTFGLRGQEYHSAEWDSWKGDDGRWVVALSWRAGRSDNRALWAFLPGAHGGTVTALDEHAHDLVEGLPARPLRTVGPVIDISRPDEVEPTPQEGRELRATASDTAARRDATDWSRGAPEPRRPEPPRRSVPAARTESADAQHRQGWVDGRPSHSDERRAEELVSYEAGLTRQGRVDEPATDWPSDGRGTTAREPAGSGVGRNAAAPERRPAGPEGRTTPTAPPSADVAPPAPRSGDTGHAPAPRSGEADRALSGNSETGRTSSAGHDTTHSVARNGDAAPTPSATHNGDAAQPSSAARNGDTGRASSAARNGDSAPNAAAARNGTASNAGDAASQDAIPPAPQQSASGTGHDGDIARNGNTAGSEAAPATPAGPHRDNVVDAPRDLALTAGDSDPASGNGQTGPADPACAEAASAMTDGDAARPAADSAHPVQADTDPAAKQTSPPATPKRSRKSKPVMPSWDEVLLGVRSQR